MDEWQSTRRHLEHTLGCRDGSCNLVTWISNFVSKSLARACKDFYKKREIY